MVRFTKGATNLSFGVFIKTTSGVKLGGGTSATNFRRSIKEVKADATTRVKFRFQCDLNPGVYVLNTGVVGTTNETDCFFHRLVDMAMLMVIPEPESLSAGIVDSGYLPEIEETSFRQERNVGIICKAKVSN